MDTYKVKLAEGGRVVIPARFRKALGLKTGDEVLIRLGDGEAVLSGVRSSIARAQGIVGKYVKRNRSAAQELIDERRGEARRER